MLIPYIAALVAAIQAGLVNSPPSLAILAQVYSDGMHTAADSGTLALGTITVLLIDMVLSR